MAKAVSTNKNGKISFSKQSKGKTSIGNNSSSIKFGTMNKNKRRSYKAYRGQGRP